MLFDRMDMELKKLEGSQTPHVNRINVNISSCQSLGGVWMEDHCHITKERMKEELDRVVLGIEENNGNLHLSALQYYLRAHPDDFFQVILDYNVNKLQQLLDGLFEIHQEQFPTELLSFLAKRLKSCEKKACQEKKQLTTPRMQERRYELNDAAEVAAQKISSSILRKAEKRIVFDTKKLELCRDVARTAAVFFKDIGCLTLDDAKSGFGIGLRVVSEAESSSQAHRNDEAALSALRYDAQVIEGITMQADPALRVMLARQWGLPDTAYENVKDIRVILWQGVDTDLLLDDLGAFYCVNNPIRIFRIFMPGHIAIALWNSDNNTIEYFDSSGETYVTQFIMKLLKKLFPAAEIYDVNSTGLQEEDTACQTWIWYYTWQRLVMKRSSRAIVRELKELSSKERLTLIQGFLHNLLYAQKVLKSSVETGLTALLSMSAREIATILVNQLPKRWRYMKRIPDEEALSRRWWQIDQSPHWWETTNLARVVGEEEKGFNATLLDLFNYLARTDPKHIAKILTFELNPADVPFFEAYYQTLQQDAPSLNQQGVQNLFKAADILKSTPIPLFPLDEERKVGTSPLGELDAVLSKLETNGILRLAETGKAGRDTMITLYQALNNLARVTPREMSEMFQEWNPSLQELSSWLNTLSTISIDEIGYAKPDLDNGSTKQDLPWWKQEGGPNHKI